ncbi:MAG TPA: DUF2333 family protein [Hyphomicrobiales bacterium]|nr:DUF2333 family protein [Hyphomicrobiales bacterium]
MPRDADDSAASMAEDPGAPGLDAPGARRWLPRHPLAAGLAVAVVALLLLIGLAFLYFDDEPELFDVRAEALARAGDMPERVWPGVTLVSTLSRTVDILLHKHGGYLSNDVLPPGVLMDDIPNWEFGVVSQVRDLAKALRNDMTRSQTQSREDPDLSVAEPHFNYQNDAWLLPSTESEYEAGRKALERFLARLMDERDMQAQFYARADNLAEWLALVEKRLGSLSQRLSASVAQERENTDIASLAAAAGSTDERLAFMVKTPWLEIDDVFYEARGSAWALLLFLRAVEVDFGPVLQDKNALASLRQVIRELEGTQGVVWSPIILNGSGFGLVANHSITMASYIGRASVALRDLRRLLEQG